MKKKIIATTAIAALAFTMLGSSPVMAEEKTTGVNYVDENKDGICDNYKEGTCEIPCEGNRKNEECDGTQRRLGNCEGAQRRSGTCDGTQQGRQVRNRCGTNKN